MPRDPYGKGKVQMILVPSRFDTMGHRQKARVGLAGCPIGVVTVGIYAGWLAIPHFGVKQSHEVRHRIDEEGIEFTFSSMPVHYRLVGDVYTALRQVDHALSTYNRRGLLGEKAKLFQAVGVARELYEKLLGLTVGTLESSAGDIRKLARQMIGLVGQRPTDPLKVVIRDSAVSILAVLDSRQRVNQSAKLSQVVRIRQELHRRLATIQAIEPNLFRRQRALCLLIEEAEKLFNDASKHITAQLESLTGAGILSVLKRQQLVTGLHDFANELERLDIRPYLNPCRRMANELRKGAYYISVGRNQAARTVLRRTVESLKLRAIRSDLERFISYLTELLSRPDRQLPTKDAVRITRGLSNIRQRLGQVDEFRFIHPVSRTALTRLSDAIGLAGKTVGVQVNDLAKLKDSLKEVARPL
ncbi:MAG: hypothetical protein WC544_03745 [Patescibacteria group bacterium]